MYFVVFLKVQVFGNDKESERSEEGGGWRWEPSPANSRGRSQRGGKGPGAAAHFIIVSSDEEQPAGEGQAARTHVENKKCCSSYSS